MPVKYTTIATVLLIIFALMMAISPFIAWKLNKPALISAVRSYSMEPVLTRGDLVIVWPTGFGYSYKIDQVVVFRSVEYGICEWTMHRIIGGDTEMGYITQGDANTYIDQEVRYPPIQADWIAGIAPSIGRYVLKVPYLGYVVLFFSETVKNQFILPFLLMLLALFILWKPENNC